jgi:GPH family glycoside/pentoside/hexuronide:cation symporter
LVTIPYSTLYPEMWTDIEDRSEVIIYRESFSVVGGIIAMVVFPFLVDSLSNQYGLFGGWRISGKIMAVIFSGSFILALFGIREKSELGIFDKPLPFTSSLKTAITNRSWITAKIAILMTTCMIDWVSAIVPFFATHSLGMGVKVISVMMGFQLVGTFAFFPIWRKICIQHGSKMAMAISMTAFNVVLLLGLVAQNLFGLAVMGLTGGIAIGGLLLARKLMIADVIDEDEIKTGVRREGIYMGIGAAISKISMVIVGAGMSLLLSTYIGYSPDYPDPPSMAMGIRLGLVGFPAIFTMILLVFLRFYPLGRERVLEIKNSKRRSKTMDHFREY